MTSNLAGDIAASAEILEQPRARVLIVDDDDRNLLALAEVLDDLADVVQASSGEEALRALLQQQFAVIVLDVLMPGIDGYETAQLVRAREQSRDTPIIFLTAINKEDGHLLRGYDSGAVDFVFKPFDPIIVRSKVAVFVSLYEKTLEIERNAAVQQKLLEEKLQAQEQSYAALRALRESEKFQELILSSLPIAVYVEDQASPVPKFVSGNIKQITGFDVADFETDPALWHSRVQRTDETPTLPFKNGGRTLEYRWLHPDGTQRIFLDQAVPLATQVGALAGTIRDITEQRLLQDQLFQAQKMDAVGKLTGGVAHDFNNLLASVLSGLALIEKRARLEGKVLEILGMTRHAAEQGKHLVSRLLSFSRRQNLSPQLVKLSSVSRSLDAMLSPTLGGLVTLKWDLQPQLWDIFVDASQLELAIMNLVINSRDALPSGGTVTIRMVNQNHAGSDELARGQYVVLTVSDDGDGIAADLLTKVLDPFFTTKEVGRGTGLGLSMAYGFARQSGGTLRIESELGEGTDVSIWLPMAKELVDAAPSAAPLQPIVLDADQPLRVLLVDDSNTLRKLTDMQLTEAGYTVVSAANGAEALSIFEGNPFAFDVLLTDYAMPNMSGLELLAEARRRRSDLPAVVITGYADVDAMQARPTDVTVVDKPFTTGNLLKALTEATRNIGSQTSSSSPLDEQANSLLHLERVAFGETRS